MHRACVHHITNSLLEQWFSKSLGGYSEKTKATRAVLMPVDVQIIQNQVHTALLDMDDLLTQPHGIATHGRPNPEGDLPPYRPSHCQSK